MDPVGVGFIGFDFEFHDAWGLVGMDGLDGLLHFRPVRLLGLYNGDDFLRIRDFTLPPVCTLDREIVRTGDELITQQCPHDLLRRPHVSMRDVDDDEFHRLLSFL